MVWEPHSTTGGTTAHKAAVVAGVDSVEIGGGMRPGADDNDDNGENGDNGDNGDIGDHGHNTMSA